MKILEMNGIHKRFPGTVALDNVDFELERGEIHALMGQNGAGKSTLVKIISGVIAQTQGTILLEGKPVAIHNPKEAIKLGISIISQELSLCPYLSVAENIFLGRIPENGAKLLDLASLKNQARQILERLNLDVDPTTPVGHLSVAQKQIIEIAKAISRNSKILLMDEPTSALNPSEIQSLFTLVRDLQSQGITIVFISHKLEETFELCDRLTILRDGKKLGTYTTSEITLSKVTELMIGRTLENYFPDEEEEKDDENNEIVMSVSNMSRGNKLHDINFELKKGEVLGLYGLLGAGRTEILRALYGADKIDSGKIVIGGKVARKLTPAASMKRGLALIPEERKQEGLFLELSVAQNISIANMDKVTVGKIFISKKKERKLVNEYVKKLTVKTSSIDAPINSLSGGNQQKAILSKWMARQPKILLLDEPTRGIDVGAKSEIYSLIKQYASENYSIIVVSSELPEITRLSDRILMIRNGSIVHEVKKAQFKNTDFAAILSEK